MFKTLQAVGQRESHHTHTHTHTHTQQQQQRQQQRQQQPNNDNKQTLINKKMHLVYSYLSLIEICFRVMLQ